MARFWEVLRCVGVDERARPFPGMIVPLGGSNFVALSREFKPLLVRSNHKGLEVNEVEPTELIKKRTEMNIELSQPGVDGQLKQSKMPDLISSVLPPYYLKIKAPRLSIDFPGAAVQAFSGRTLEATLRVVVLKEMRFSIAIRNVQVRAKDGRMTFHSDKPCNPESEVANMNAIYNPQANIAFDLVPSSHAEVEESSAIRPLTSIDTYKQLDVFEKMKVPNVAMTFFLIHSIHDGGSGRMHSQEGVGFIAGSHTATSFAHEMGHFLGGRMENGKWVGLVHTYDPDRNEDIRQLMRDGGAGWQIPFDLVKQFRGFSARRQVH